MKSKSYFYSLIPLFLLILSVILVSCGGSDSTGVIPGNISQAPAVQLVSKEVSGYIFATNGLTSSRAGEEVSQRFVILDVPLSGEDAFLSQVSSTLQEEHPEDWSNPKMQELFNKLSAELSGWQPLSAINGAQLFTVYQDSRSENPLTVGEDGYFEGSVMVASTDDLVKFEVVIGEEDCYAVETIASSDIAASEGDNTVIQSCPEVILNFPGWCTIFKVKASPVINLKEAGLTFTLNDSSMGCITENPVYLRCRGSKKYNVGYGIFYANPGLTTPVDTTITASTTTGLTLSIFTEVIGSSASIQGHVGGAGVVPVFGFVYSFGCHAFDCLDEAGNYHLSSVFKGHDRAVCAVYWLVQPDGTWKKCREGRTIEFFGEDLSGFDLPEGVQPIPTIRPPYDKFYDERISEVLEQFDQWKIELGREAAIERTVSWLEGELSEGPLIPEEITGALIDEYDSSRFWVCFDDGLSWCLGAKIYAPINFGYISPRNKKLNNDFPSLPIIGSDVGTVGSSKILMLAPFEWQERELEKNLGSPNLYDYMVYGGVADDLIDKGYTVDRVMTKLVKEEVTEGIGMYELDPNANPRDIIFEWRGGDIVTPFDLENMQDYGIIYIATHANEHGMISNVVHERHEEIPLERDLLHYWLWFYRNSEFRYNPLNFDPDEEGLWSYITFEVEAEGIVYRYKMLLLTKKFFQNKSYNNSIVYIDACYSWHLRDAFMNIPAEKPKVYIGNTGPAYIPWSRLVAYQFFNQMMYGFKEPIPIPRPDGIPIVFPPSYILPVPPPMSAKDSYDKLGTEGLNPDSYPYVEPYSECRECKLEIDTQNNQYDDTYFPALVDITVQGD